MLSEDERDIRPIFLFIIFLNADAFVYHNRDFILYQNSCTATLMFARYELREIYSDMVCNYTCRHKWKLAKKGNPENVPSTYIYHLLN